MALVALWAESEMYSSLLFFFFFFLDSPKLLWSSVVIGNGLTISSQRKWKLLSHSFLMLQFLGITHFSTRSGLPSQNMVPRACLMAASLKPVGNSMKTQNLVYGHFIRCHTENRIAFWFGLCPSLRTGCFSWHGANIQRKYSRNEKYEFILELDTSECAYWMDSQAMTSSTFSCNQDNVGDLHLKSAALIEFRVYSLSSQ